MNLNGHEDWIRANASCMTIHDMMDELGHTNIKSFRNFCTRNHIFPITTTEKNKLYIFSLHKKKPMKYFTEKLSLSIDRIEQLYRDLGIEEPDFTKKRLSPREIFNRCHVSHV